MSLTADFPNPFYQKASNSSLQAKYNKRGESQNTINLAGPHTYGAYFQSKTAFPPFDKFWTGGWWVREGLGTGLVVAASERKEKAVWAAAVGK